MKAVLVSAFNEMESFLQEYELETIATKTQVRDDLRRLFKKYYPILIWDTHISSNKLWDDKNKSDTFNTYFAEMISDLCQSVLLFTHGMYKPSLLILRSAVENFFRCCCIMYDKDITKLTSVFELIAAVKAIKAIKDDKHVIRHIENLHQAYGELCGYVHSSGAQYMSQKKMFGSFPHYSEKEATKITTLLTGFCTNVSSVLSVTLTPLLLSFHHTHQDLVLDALSKELKSYIHSKSYVAAP
jgi:hypothetical protein